MKEQQLRTPEAIYTAEASITFERREGKVIYYIRKWLDGYIQELMATGIVKDYDQVLKFKSANGIDEVMKIHNLGDVK